MSFRTQQVSLILSTLLNWSIEGNLTVQFGEGESFKLGTKTDTRLNFKAWNRIVYISNGPQRWRLPTEWLSKIFNSANEHTVGDNRFCSLAAD